VPDRPVSFTDLALHATQGVDYDFTLREPGGAVTIVALHGGALAPRTAELAAELAGDGHNLFILRAQEDRPELRVSPLHARQARLDALIARSTLVLSIDSFPDEAAVARIGGASLPLRNLLLEGLTGAGFYAVRSETPGIDVSPAFFFNRGREGGVELALARGLLESLYTGAGSAQRRAAFADVVEPALERCLASLRSDLGRTLDRFERATARIPSEIRRGPGRIERNGERP
jgi:phage replication-related protein YjqB (UPF0714/DUF867 family)